MVQPLFIYDHNDRLSANSSEPRALAQTQELLADDTKTVYTIFHVPRNTCAN